MLNVHQVCLRYSVSRSTVFRLLQSGDFPRPLKVGKVLRWTVERLEQWEREQLAEQVGQETKPADVPVHT